MNTLLNKQAKFARRKIRIRARIAGTEARPRLAIFRSHKYLYAQLINDDAGRTVAAADTRKLKGATPLERAKALGVEMAKKAKDLKITKVVFDRGGYLYAGKIKTVADAAREGGLEF